MPKKRTTRIYTRVRGRRPRYYVDLRDLGGGRERLVAPGEKAATSDPDIAAELAAQMVKKLKERQSKRVILGIEKEATLKGYAAEHLRKKAKEKATLQWLQSAQNYLQAAVDHFGDDTDLTALTPGDFTTWVDHLRRQDNGRGGMLTDATVRKYLNAVSNLYRRAVSEGYVKRNPVSDMFEKPTEEWREASYLEPEESALLLESARTYQAPVLDGAFPWMHPLLATFLLTGGRKSEVLGLEVDDVSLRLGKIYFRPNRWRRLKTEGSTRSVPLWPQLEKILRGYLVEREQQGGLGSLLFPGRGTSERMVADVRKALDRIAARVGFEAGSVRLHQLRHTYTAARIQTLDRGAPVALYTVARELGHKSQAMIEKRYGHVHDRATDRTEDVSFRIEAYRDTVADRLALLGHH
jgi:integrase